jgi:RNA polymerase sigma-70 factor (ECF subfamily)
VPGFPHIIVAGNVPLIVFLMNRIDGKKYREIAELLDISQKTVEKRMSAALQILKSQIENL